MKKLFLLLAVILSLQCAMAQDVSFFVKGGIGLSNYIGKDAGYDAKLSYRIGAGLDVHAQNIWGFQTGLYFTESGAKSSLFFETIKLNPWYIEIPLMATATIPIGNKFKMSIGAGPYLAAGIAGKLKNKAGELSKDTNLFGDIEDGNLGFKRFDMGLGINLNFEVKRIIFGIDSKFGLTRVEKGIKSHNLSTQLTVGYRF